LPDKPLKHQKCNGQTIIPVSQCTKHIFEVLMRLQLCLLGFGNNAQLALIHDTNIIFLFQLFFNEVAQQLMILDYKLRSSKDKMSMQH
jgi:hypothetical protein